jgi:hypothetical protein
MMLADNAVSKGLADRVETFHGALARLASSSGGGGGSRVRAELARSKRLLEELR